MIFTKYTFNGDGYCVQEIEVQDSPKYDGEDYYRYEAITPYEMYPGDSESYGTDLFVPINNNVVLDDDYGIFQTFVFQGDALTNYGKTDDGDKKFIILRGTEGETSKHAINLYNKFLMAYIEHLKDELKNFTSMINPKRKEPSDIYEEDPDTV